MKNKTDVTIYDIAKKLNISPSTVSRGLNNLSSVKKETRQKIAKTALELGYRHNTFASNLRKKKTNTIGVVIPRLNSYFMSSVIYGMESIINKEGYNLLISQSKESHLAEVKNIETMYNSRVDGLMVSLAYDTENLDHFKHFIKKGIPIVLFDRVYEHPKCINIIIDNSKAGYDAIKHLIQQGCKRIVYLGGNLKCSVYKERFNGYKKALDEYKIPFNEDLVIINMLDEQAGIDAAEYILKMDKMPDGIFAANDNSAVAAMCHLKKAGIKIPEDIAIIGFNNNPVSTFTEPNLSTINYPGTEMGITAANTLVNILKNTQADNIDKIFLSYELILRNSSIRST